MSGLGNRPANRSLSAFAIPHIAAWAMAALLAACAGPAAGDARPATPALAAVPAGPFVMGSDAAEREAAYQLDEAAYGHSRTRERGWYDNEPARRTVELGDYFITRTPITNAQYAAFVQATGHPAPDVDRATWKGYRLIHPYARTRRHAWSGTAPPTGRADHPVVLISHGDARAYAAWLTEAGGRRWRLPSEAEWEKAARGAEGRRFPWGEVWDPARLNSHDRGPFDTVPVGTYPSGGAPTACSMAPARSSSGPKPGPAGAASVSSSRAAPGTIPAAESAGRRRAMAARRRSSTF